MASLFDHLVGAAEQRERERDAERFRGLEVDDKLDLYRLIDGQLGRLLALEHSRGVDANLAIGVLLP